MEEIIINSQEQNELNQQVSLCEQKAESVTVKNADDYEYAGELVKQVKSLQKKAEDYWEPLRASAYGAYQAVLERKKQMVEPMKKAEKILKNKMSEYLAEQERIRKAQEEELKRLAREETERKLAEAAEAERAGNDATAEYTMAEAEVIDSMIINTSISQPTKKIMGVSSKKSWEIVEINQAKVPVSITGVVIRPVDEKAVLRLIKASNGQIEIPGIEYRETYDISVRA